MQKNTFTEYGTFKYIISLLRKIIHQFYGNLSHFKNRAFARKGTQGKIGTFYRK